MPTPHTAATELISIIRSNERRRSKKTYEKAATNRVIHTSNHQLKRTRGDSGAVNG